jgi:hypothetical protein
MDGSAASRDLRHPSRRIPMNGESRRRFLAGMIAGLGGIYARNAIPEPARAARSKPVKFDISAKQFEEDCVAAGGEFANWGDGEYTCYFDGWRMDCSKVTGQCRITCDPGVKCVQKKRLPNGVPAALNSAANIMDATVSKASMGDG